MSTIKYSIETRYNTLSEALNDLYERGYTFDFNKMDGNEIKKLVEKNELLIKEVYRFEGMSNPSDMSVVYAIESTDGKKGVIIDAYGTYNNPEILYLISKLRIS